MGRKKIWAHFLREQKTGLSAAIPQKLPHGNFLRDFRFYPLRVPPPRFALPPNPQGLAAACSGLSLTNNSFWNTVFLYIRAIKQVYA
jgi:hypothetical protein